ncbi:flavodoxin domain-containing protein [Clostridium culturomicium]|uniref:flavodoxin domain-containing protein n=1 Tax=Clostridium culturomicium TaxID=1499683 RepID=UPI0006938218|nr:flavodoxin domain-containing protein [Clostridium culturomicium]
MKILIAYTTRYGAAEACAKKLAEELNGECDLVNLKEAKNVEISKYDKVILGGSIYAGNSQAELRAFGLEKCDELCKKPLGLYLSCMGFDAASVESYFWATFPGELLDHACAIKSFGGVFDFKKMNFFERTIIKMMGRNESAKKGVKNLLNGKEKINTISLSRINKFAKDVNTAIHMDKEKVLNFTDISK